MQQKEQPAIVGIGGISYAARGSLTCLAVGSCVALGLIYEKTGRAGLAHIFLPRAPATQSDGQSPGKYADLALREMTERLCAKEGCAGLAAYVAGGARMFPKGFQQDWLDVGALNSEAVRALLEGCKIPIRFWDVGGTAARNVRLDVAARTMITVTGTARQEHSAAHLQTNGCRRDMKNEDRG